MLTRERTVSDDRGRDTDSADTRTAINQKGDMDDVDKILAAKDEEGDCVSMEMVNYDGGKTGLEDVPGLNDDAIIDRQFTTSTDNIDYEN